MTKQWVDIPGYVGLYQVSSDSEVKRVAGKTKRVVRGKEIEQPIAEKILTPAGTYPLVSLCRDGKSVSHYVHHLVAEAFIGPRPDGMQVCHNDGNPQNVHKSNLRYDTPTGNASDRHLHGTHAKGESNPMAKYSEEEVSQIKKDLLTTPQYKVAEKWNIPKSTVRGIAQGKSWGDIKPAE